MACGNDQGVLRIIDLRNTTKDLQLIAAHEAPITELKYKNSEPNTIITSSLDGELLKWTFSIDTVSLVDVSSLFGSKRSSSILSFDLNANDWLTFSTDLESIYCVENNWSIKSLFGLWLVNMVNGWFLTSSVSIGGSVSDSHNNALKLLSRLWSNTIRCPVNWNVNSKWWNKFLFSNVQFFFFLELFFGLQSFINGLESLIVINSFCSRTCYYSKKVLGSLKKSIIVLKSLDSDD